MKTQPILIAITVGIGVMVGLLINSRDSASVDNLQVSEMSDRSVNNNHKKAVTLAELQEMIEQLSTTVQQEQKERILLSQQVNQVLQQANNSIADNNKDGLSDNNVGKTKIIKTSPRPPLDRNDGWINAKLLLSAGVDENTVQDIVQVYESVEMDKLYLRDMAVREGWTGTPRFREEMRQINNRTNELRERLNKSDYDAFLFATGQPNRVTVLSALGNSPAAQAGIQPGDIILKYDNVPIYSWGDLRAATAAGDKESMVQVTVDRDGEKMDYFVKRGPLGIRLDHLSINPKK